MHQGYKLGYWKNVNTIKLEQFPRHHACHKKNIFVKSIASSLHSESKITTLC